MPQDLIDKLFDSANQIEMQDDIKGFPARAMNFFTSKGLAPHHAAGIVGNLMQESLGGKANAVNPKSGAYGLAQHLGSRKKELFKFSGTTNPTEQQQLEFIMHELNTYENPAFQHLLSTKDVDSAAKSFADKFERMGAHEAAYKTRKTNARKALEAIGNYLGPSPAFAADDVTVKASEDPIDKLFGAAPTVADQAARAQADVDLIDQLFPEQPKAEIPAPPSTTSKLSAFAQSVLKNFTQSNELPIDAPVEDLTAQPAALPSIPSQPNETFMRPVASEKEAKDFYGTSFMNPFGPGVQTLMGLHGFGPMPPGGFNELGAPLNEKGESYNQFAASAFAPNMDMVLSSIDKLDKLASHPYDVAKGLTEFAVHGAPSTILGFAGAAQKGLSRLTNVLMTGRGTLNDVWNDAKKGFEDAVNPLEPGRKQLMASLEAPRELVRNLTEGTSLAPIVGKPDEADPAMVGQLLMSPGTAVSVAIHDVADRFEKYPNVQGALRFIAEGAMLATLGKVYHGGSEKLRTDLDKIAAGAADVIAKEKVLQQQGAPKEAMYRIDAEKQALEFEASQVLNNVDPVKVNTAELIRKGEEAAAEKGQLTRASAMGEALRLKNELGMEGTELAALVQEKFGVDKVIKLKKDQMIELAEELRRRKEEGGKIEESVVEEPKPTPTEPVITKGMSALERAKARKAAKEEKVTKEEVKAAEEVPITPEEKGISSTRFRQDPEQTKMLTKELEGRKIDNPETLTTKLVNDVNRWLDGEDIGIANVRNVLSDLATRVKNPEYERMLIEVLGDKATADQFADTVSEAAVWARKARREKVEEVVKPVEEVKTVEETVQAEPTEPTVPTEPVPEAPIPAVKAEDYFKSKLDEVVEQGPSAEELKTESRMNMLRQAKIEADQRAMEKYYGKTVDELTDKEVQDFFVKKSNKERGGGGVKLTIGIDPSVLIGPLKWMFEEAKDLFRKGVSVHDIWRDTGFFLNPYDKKWRFYISDKEAVIHDAKFNHVPFQDGRISVKLNQILGHPRLFEQVPELMETKVRIVKVPIEGTTKGWFDGSTNTISIANRLLFDKEEFKAALIHEISHNVQKKFDFARGGNTDTIISTIKGEELERYAQKADQIYSRKINTYKREINELKTDIEFINAINKNKVDAFSWTKVHELIDLKRESERLDSLYQENPDAYEAKFNEVADLFSSKANEMLDGFDAINPHGSISYYEMSEFVYRLIKAGDLNRLKTKNNAIINELAAEVAKLTDDSSELSSPFAGAVKAAIKKAEGLDYEAYKNLAGEIEARDNQARLNLPDERLPLTSEVIDPRDVIIKVGQRGTPESSSGGGGLGGTTLNVGFPIVDAIKLLIGKYGRDIGHVMVGKRPMIDFRIKRLGTGNNIRYRLEGMDALKRDWVRIDRFDTAAEAKVEMGRLAAELKVSKEEAFANIARKKGMDPNNLTPAETKVIVDEQNAKDAFEQSWRADSYDGGKFWTRFKNEMSKAFIAEDYPLRKLLRQFGIDGYEMSQLLDSRRGGLRYGEHKYAQLMKEALDGIKKSEYKKLAELNLLTRLQDIFGYEPGFKAGKYTADGVSLRLQTIFDDIAPDRARALEAANETMFEHVKGWVDELVDKGLITKEVGDKLKDHDYRQIKKLQIENIFDYGEKEVAGQKIVKKETTPVDRLGHGSGTLIDTDFMRMYRETALRFFSIIAENDSKLQFKEFVKNNPDSELMWFKGLKDADGKAIEKPAGFVKDRVVVGGKAETIWFHPDVAAQVMTVGSDMTYRLAAVLSTVTGTRLLKNTAVALSPVWAAFKGFPMDVMHTYFSARMYKDGVGTEVGRMVSPFSASPPAFLFQLGRNMKNVFGDVMRGDLNGPLEAYSKNGGLLDFLVEREGKYRQGGLTYEVGKLFGKEKNIGDISTYDKIRNAIETPGKKLELLVRVAIADRIVELRSKELGITREEGWKNDAIAREATSTAIQVMPYGQAGWLVKALDPLIPFLSANVIANRTFFRAAKDRPADFATRVGYIGAATVGLTLLSHMYAKDTMMEVSENDKKKGLVIPIMGDYFKFQDSKGRWRTPLMILPVASGPMFIVTLFRALTEQALHNTGAISLNIKDWPANVVELARNSAPATIDLPPVWRAMQTYTTNQNTWGEGFTFNQMGGKTLPYGMSTVEGAKDPNISQITKDVAKLTGLSPKRLADAGAELIPQNNEFVGLFKFSYDKLFNEVPQELRQKVFMESLVKTPGIKTWLSMTDPERPYRKVGEESTANLAAKYEWERLKKDNDFNEILKLGERGVDIKDKVNNFIRTRITEPNEIDKYVNKYVFSTMSRDLPHRDYWMRNFNLPDKVKAQDFHQIWKAESSPAQRTALEKELGKLATLNYAGDEFFVELGKLRTGKNKVSK